MDHNSLSGPLPLGNLQKKARFLFDSLSRALARQTRPALAESNRDLALSTASVGVTAVGLWTMQPLLLLAGVPLVLFVYAPSFRAAWRALGKQRRIDGSVLDATRIAVCVAMGYYGTGAANAALFALSRRIIAVSEEDFEEGLRHLLGLKAEEAWTFVSGVEVQSTLGEIKSGEILMLNAGDILPAAGRVLYGSAEVDQQLARGDVLPVQKQAGDDILLGSRLRSGQLAVTVGDAPERLDLSTLRDALRQAVQDKTLVQRVGEASGRRAAPLSFFTFLLTIPWLGVNRAASFLCTSFGANMGLLGPVATRHAIQRAMREGILVKDSRALEMANFVNCLVIDGRTLLDPSVQLHADPIVRALRQHNWQQNALFGRQFAVYVLADQEYDGLRAAAATVGAEEVFVEPLSVGRVAAIDNLQRSGRVVCYVGSSPDADRADESAVMEKALVSIALGGALTAPASPAQIVFAVKNLAPLLPFFQLCGQFLERQRYSLLTPVMMDFTDITTTLFLHFGLIYSTFFNYGSLLLSLGNARTPRAEVVEDTAPVRTVAIVSAAPRSATDTARAQEERMHNAKAGKKPDVVWRRPRRSGPSWLTA